MAMGKPVIATPQALEGLAAENGIHVIRAADPQDWLTSMCHLFADDARCQQLGRNGRAYVELHHSWEACMKPLGLILDSHRGTPLHGIRNGAQQCISDIKGASLVCTPADNRDSFQTTMPVYYQANQS